ncbi:G-type lectin S-receptor-like serine/threonine-protein kinase SD2-5 [Rhodamnia argentea]|uniref:Receptor-like serine/threonine-protein kinase n=1 Tax=Rhodamnia argentea TaxID=178133 RepID=A0A8B8NCQ8_9MYRT|nr:G-type lectin S-receptor-like serine/threonine-protein kinase SD2-5 [Rhodamnia argentea]
MVSGRMISSCFCAPSPSLLLLPVLLLVLLPLLTIAESWNGPSSVSLPAVWTAGRPYDYNLTGADLPVSIKIVLYRQNSGPSFFYGFTCYYESDCYFGLFIFQLIEDMKSIRPVIVWSANHGKSMKDTAQLLLTEEGDLVLQGGDGNKIWSTDTAGKRRSAVGLNLTETGNVVLYDRSNAIIWQSFDHPADCLLPGQVLHPGMRLTSPGPDGRALTYTFTVEDRIGFVASVTTPSSPQTYYRTSDVSKMTSNIGQVVALYMNGSFGEFDLPATSLAQFIMLESDGHLRLYVHDGSYRWNKEDLLEGRISDCGYPLVCGNYGICSDTSIGPQCDCPSETGHFKQIEERQPAKGCNVSMSISCDSPNHDFAAIDNIYYFAFSYVLHADISNTTVEICKEACLSKGCSCTMALFLNETAFLGGDCYLLSDSYSLMDNTYKGLTPKALALIKVDNASGRGRARGKRRTMIILGTTVGVVLMCLVSICCIFVRCKVKADDVEDDDPDLPRLQITRFPYEDLKAMTGDFTIKLGEGGFGSVFLGTLPSGIRIAVKRLDGFGQIKKSFLVEAGTIGTIHHVNLVRLLGFCAEKSHRLLVYEYMCNGSLDKWIFHKDLEFNICWQVRRKIILDVAKGLAYLHEECHQKIIHLDIKPQNILLDEHFNAKLADFGMSKLIDKDQSHVMTTMRGTPGYLAPEWLSSIITEKVDVYSFGIVMLEVLCGRKNVDRSLPSDEVHMLTLFKGKAEREQLLDMVDKSIGDMQLHVQEAVKMMKIAAWCLQDDYSNRPSMSAVVKCLEGLVSIDSSSYSFSVPPSDSKQIVEEVTQLSALQLSGPR